MTRSVRIAIDLLGGDYAPAVVVDGAPSALRVDPNLHLHLVGPAWAAAAVRANCTPDEVQRTQTITVREAVGMADAPVRGARHDTTVRAGVAAVARGRVDGFVSAGSSGATVAAAVVVLGRVPGVRRPALAAVVPARAHPVVLLDVGATPDAAAAVLTEHAVLGTAYAIKQLRLNAPRVGLLSIGSEGGKGDRFRRAADVAMQTAALPGGARYVGNVEGHDVALGGPADVIVTDGFTGNVLLKGMEGAYALAGGEFAGGCVPRAAALLGVSGPVVVCHGAATGADLASGIALAADLIRAQPASISAGVPA